MSDTNEELQPRFQPNGYNPDADKQKFGTSEVLWWKNGIWGDAGYAIPNCGGKPTTANETMWAVHDFIGSELFTLMHQPDVKFSRPFNAEWLFKLHLALKLGVKRLGDYAVDWTDDREGDAQHALNTPKAFNVYPIPYFGGRIRQKSALKWCGIIMRLLSEIMQHSDNDYDDNITVLAAAYFQKQLNRVQKDMAMKFLGFTREQVEAPGFDIPDEAFAEANYDPSRLFTPSEMIEERMPELWWPQANDLTPINGVNAVVADQFGRRWPEADGFFGDNGATEAAFPATGRGLLSIPGARPR